MRLFILRSVKPQCNSARHTKVQNGCHVGLERCICKENIPEAEDPMYSRCILSQGGSRPPDPPGSKPRSSPLRFLPALVLRGRTMPHQPVEKKNAPLGHRCMVGHYLLTRVLALQSLAGLDLNPPMWLAQARLASTGFGVQLHTCPENKGAKQKKMEEAMWASTDQGANYARGNYIGARDPIPPLRKPTSLLHVLPVVTSQS